MDKYATAEKANGLKSQQHFTNLVALTADSNAEVGLGIRSSFTTPTTAYARVVMQNAARTKTNERLMKLLTTTIIFFWAITSFGQTNTNFITKQQALEDLKIFEISLTEIHPNIYRYTSKSEFDNAFTEARGSIGNTIELVQFNAIIISLMVKVHCGHSFNITVYFDEKKGVLPLEVKILDDKIFVMKNFSSDKDPEPGSEILSINEIGAADLLNKFRNNTTSDGYNLTFKDRIIENGFRGIYATQINQPNSFKIEFEDYSSKTHKISTVDALPNDSIFKQTRESAIPAEKLLSLIIDKENDVAIFELRSFMAQRIRRESGQKLNRTIKKSFREIRQSKVSNLIIDVRWNTGGKASAPPLLFSYITNKDFKFKQKIIFRHGYRFTYPQYLNRIKFDDWVNKHVDKKINDSTYELTHHRNTRKHYKANKKSFQGRVYLVVNGMTASAGAEFASLVSVNSNAIIVGEETGGDFNGVNGYERTHLKLPNSKIGVLIAGKRSVMAWDENRNIGHGVPTTYEVRPSVEDLLTGQDTEIKFIYSLIRK